MTMNKLIVGAIAVASAIMANAAAPDSWFQHIALEVPGTEQSNECCEPEDDNANAEATK